MVSFKRRKRMKKKKQISKNDTIFISGPITNEPKYRENFKKAKKHLKELGYKNIINPVKLADILPASIGYDEFLNIDLSVLAACDTIYALSNWEKSNGASTEMKFAEEHGLNIIFEDDVLEA